MNPRVRLASPCPLSLVHLVVLVALASAGLTSASARPAGATTRAFRQNSARDFEEGEARGTTILPDGEIVSGLRTVRFGVEAAFVWCSAPSSDGKTMYFGSADEGKIFAVPSGAERGAPARVVARLEVPWVSALSARADGRLLAAGNPGGALFLVDPTRGTRAEVARLPATHVWALADDARARRTYVATGVPGKIFEVDDATGHVRPLWDAHDAHVLALLREDDGTLLAGTSEQAILYRVSPSGTAEAIQDFEADEVRALVRAPSGLYVAVNDFDGSPGSTSPALAATALGAKGTKVVAPPSGSASGNGAGPTTGASTGTATPAAGVGSTGLLPRPGARKAKSAVYRIDAAGRVEQVFALADGYLTSLVVAPDGSVYAASGAQGRVHRIRPDGTSSLVVDVPERQILTLASTGAVATTGAGSTLWLGTGDAAAVYAARGAGTPGAERESAEYLSKVLDADYLASWGALHWRGAHVGFETRTGNTAKPDGSWRPWRPLVAVSEAGAGEVRDEGVGHVDDPGGTPGGAGTPSKTSTPGRSLTARQPKAEGAVTSHPARYLQYRATLHGKDARLREVTLFFMPQNQRARITQLAAADSGGGMGAGGGGIGIGSLLGSASPTTAAAGATTSHVPHSPVLRLRWKVDNDDGDELVYRVAVRPVDGTVWRALAGMGGATGDPLTKPELDWNTDAIPDGAYVVRVTASDERSQPAERALSSFLDSEPLLVDNRKPEVLAVIAKYPTISGRIEDRASPITEIAMSIDGGEWHLLSPTDGIADEKVESFAFTLPRLAPGPHAVAIRASDSSDNLGALQLEVTAP